MPSGGKGARLKGSQRPQDGPREPLGWNTAPGSERWRSCHGGYYEVSDMGRVRRARPGLGTHVGRLLVPRPEPSGYIRMSLRDGSNRRQRYAHVLVALAFLGPCPQGKEVNHINGIKTDNRLGNLEYLTSGENQVHAFRTGLKQPSNGEHHYGSKLTNDQVLRIRSYEGWFTQNELAAMFGVSQPNIGMILRRLTWQHI